MINQIKKIFKYFDIHISKKNNMIKKIIGLDINDYYISFVLLTGTNVNDIKVEDYDLQLIPNNIVTDGKIIDANQIVVILQNFLARVKFITNNCILAIPYNLSNIIFFVNPLNSFDSAYELAKTKVKNISPLELINFDVCNIVNQQKKEYVLLVMTKKEYINTQMNLTKKVDLNLLYIDELSINIFNNNIFFIQHLSDYLDKTFCILFIDFHSSSINFFYKNQRLYTNQLDLNVNYFIEELKTNFNLSDDDIIKLIANINVSDKEKYHTYILNFLQKIIDQTEKFIKIFELTRIDMKSSVSLILVNVFGILFNDIAKLIFERIGIKSIISSSITQVECTKYDSNSNVSSNVSNVNLQNCNNAFGLALRGFL